VAQDPRHFVIIGGGQSGGWAAKTLRDRGFSGQLTLVGEDMHPPYERPPLSKALLAGADPASTYLWPEQALRDRDIALILGAPATSIDKERKAVTLAGGRTLQYDRLLIATGAQVRRLDIAGTDLEGVHYLRNLEDSAAIRRSVGGGWIGLELAAAAVAKGLAVTLIEAGAQVCGRSLPRQSATVFSDMHVRRGVDLRLGTALTALEGNDTVQRALLTDGSHLDVATVVIGIGIEPNVALAEAAQLEVENGIVVDENLRTGDPSIFACGDVASLGTLAGKRVRLETWQNAQNQGIAVAKSMLDETLPPPEPAWFWSDQYDLNFQMLGTPAATDAMIVKGDPETGKFIQYFVRDDRLTAVAAFNSPRELREAKRLMRGNAAFLP
jgi:3-phenylpropionate/trans-cinnamate dioxygenase ferredoxin reductase subunit